MMSTRSREVMHLVTDFINRTGFPIFVVCVLFYIGQPMLSEIFRKHVEYMETSGNVIREQSVVLKKLSDNLEHVTENNAKILQLMQEQNQILIHIQGAYAQPDHKR